MAGSPVVRSVHEGLLSPLDIALVERRRAPLITRASGRVLELGGGRGANLAHYGPAVTRVDLIGVEPAARTMIERTAASRSVPMAVLDGPGRPLSMTAIDDASYDCVVATFVLCAVEDLRATVEQIRRVLVPGGHLLFFEHVPPTGGRSLLRQLTAPAWLLASGGCDLNCDIPAAVTDAGFLISTLERSIVPTFNLSLRTVATGLARRPSGPAVRPVGDRADDTVTSDVTDGESTGLA